MEWYAGEVGVKVVDEAPQLHGGYGCIDEYDISRFYRDAKIVEIQSVPQKKVTIAPA